MAARCLAPRGLAVGLVAATIAASAGVLAVAGCSKLSVGGGSGSGSTAGAPAAPSAKVEITAPARASFQVPGPIAVEGRVTDPALNEPVAGVTVNGQPVTLDADGRFATTVTLVPGMNTIDARASMMSGRRGSATIGVIAGEYGPALTPISQAAQIRVNDIALDAIASIVESVLRTADLKSLFVAGNPLLATDLLGFIRVTIDVKDVVYSDIRSSIDSTPAGLVIRAEVLNPVLTIDAFANVIATFGIQNVELRADSAVITTTLDLDARPDGTVDVTTSAPTTTFTNFHVIAPGIAPILVGLIQGRVETEVRNVAQDAIVNKIPTFLETSIAKVLRPAPFDLLGKPYTVELFVESISFDQDGVSTSYGLRCAGGTGLTLLAGHAAGAYTTPGTPPVLQPGPRGVTISVNDDAWNRALHAAWAGGVFDIDLDAAFFAKLNVQLPFQLEAGALGALLPELAAVAPPTAPVSVRLRPALPPLLVVQGSPDLFLAQAGEVAVEIHCDRGSGWEHVFTFVAQLEVGATCGLSAQGLSFSASSLPRLRFQVVSEPMVEIDDRRLEVFGTVLLTATLPQLLNTMQTIAIPYLPQLRTFSVAAYRDGPMGDFLTITGDLAR